MEEKGYFNNFVDAIHLNARSLTEKVMPKSEQDLGLPEPKLDLLATMAGQ